MSLARTVEEAGGLWRRARDLYAEARVDAGVEECDARLSRLEGRN